MSLSISLLFRALTIALACCAHAGSIIVACVKALIGNRDQLAQAMGKSVAGSLASAGGAFPKFGQILSTRPDLLPKELCLELAVLQDQMPALKPNAVETLVQSEFSRWPFKTFDVAPIASATIAQVHRAVLARSEQVVALKIKRPNVTKQIDEDCRLSEVFAPVLQLLPAMRGVPVLAAVREAGAVLRLQTDFKNEADNLIRLRRDFRHEAAVLVPSVDLELSSSNILCMEYIPGLRKITDPDIPDRQARELTTLGLRCLYRMIFETGFLHCDLHPGNLMVDPQGRLVILDAGLMIEIDDKTKNAFVDFFAAIALRNGRRAAQIVRATAATLPPNLDVDAFDREVAALVVQAGGLSAEHFQVAAFVSELFAIQARHGIRGTSRFSLIILAMLIYEGIAKQRYRSLDFQKEAMPFVMASLLSTP